MSGDYKSRKEAFVSNLTGGDISEINQVTLVAPAAALLWSALQSRRSLFAGNEGYLPLLVDVLLNVGAMLFATTVYASYPAMLGLLLVTPAVWLYFQKPTGPFSSSPAHLKPQKKDKPKKPTPSTTSSTPLASLPVRPFLTAYRGAMMIITALSILAVDFRVFPRRFAKVETWGTSLMDLGVGSFVFSGGLVSARQVLRDRSAGSNKRLLGRLTSAARHALPMVALGLVRLWSVKGLDYAEHVTEYGVHWNFFFTLALLGPVVEVAHAAAYALVPSYEALALLVAGAYQVALESTALKEFILIAPRGPGWLAKNREGVCSFVGYFAIFLAGRAAGLQVIARDSARDPRAARRHLLLKLGGWSAVWAVLFYFNAYGAWGYGAGFAVSRRMANLPYVLWTAAFNNAQLWLFCAIETVFFPAVHQATSAEQEAEAVRFASSEVMEAYNRNGLAVFLLANLLTGAVNLGVDTLGKGTGMAMAILGGYAGVLTAVAVVLARCDVKLKI